MIVKRIGFTVLVAFLASFIMSGSAGAARAAGECDDVGRQGQVLFMLCTQDADATGYEFFGRAACLGSPADVCIAWFWKDRRKVPSRLPMTDAQVNAAVAIWSHKDRQLIVCEHGGC